MWKILIVTDEFPPCFAPRMAYLAKLLSDNDFYVSVITSCTCNYNNTYNFNYGSAKVLRIENRDTKYKSAQILKKIFCPHDQFTNLCRKMRDAVVGHLMSEKPDIIIASASHKSYVLSAVHYAASKFNIPWIVDYRDIYEQVNFFEGNTLMKIVKFIYKKKSIYVRNKLLKKCNKIITVSEEHTKILGFLADTVTIMNGYDEDLFNIAESNANDKLTLSFGGTLLKGSFYSGPRMLIKLLHQVISKNPQMQLEIKFFISKNDEFYIKNLDFYNEVSRCVTFCEILDMRSYIKEIQKSDVLIQFGSPFTTGVMTTKLFEYIGIYKHLLLVGSDKGCVENMFLSENLGDIVNDVETGVQVIKRLYTEWCHSGHIKPRYEISTRKKFSRKNCYSKYLDLIKDTIVS